MAGAWHDHGGVGREVHGPLFLYEAYAKKTHKNFKGAAQA
jgi:hypothetical protein